MSLERIWSAVQQLFRSRTGSNEPRELAEIRHDILDQVRGKIQELSASQYVFPFDRILIEVRPRSAAERAAIQTAWIDRGELHTDIRSALARADCEYPKDLAVETRFREDQEGDAERTGRSVGVVRDDAAVENFWLTFENVRPSAAQAPAPEPGAPLCLTVLNGAAEPASIQLSAANTNLGRLREVFDQDGQLIRSNDVAFAEIDNGVNETVSRTHAHIARQSDGRFALVNSRRNDRNPTAILRNGRSIPVILLAEPIERGDIIQLGRARISVS
jgi:hypothetical protein